MTSARCGSFFVRNSCAAMWSKGRDNFSVVVFIIIGAPSIAKFLPSSQSLAAMSKSSSGEECHTGLNGVEVTGHLFECNLNLTGHAWDRMLCSASFEPKRGWRG